MTSGYAQGLALVCRALAAGRREADRDGGSEQPRRSGHRDGAPALRRVDRRRRGGDAHRRAGPRGPRRGRSLTPAHQQPTGVVLSRERRPALAGLVARSAVPSRSRTTTTPSIATTVPPSERFRGSPRTDRLRRHHEQDARARAPPRLAGSPRVAAPERGHPEKLASRSRSLRASSSTRSRTSWRAASWIATSAACASAIAAAATRSSRARFRAPTGGDHRHRRRPASDHPAPGRSPTAARSATRPSAGASRSRRWPSTGPRPTRGHRSCCSGMRRCPSRPCAPASGNSLRRCVRRGPEPDPLVRVPRWRYSGLEPSGRRPGRSGEGSRPDART